MTLRHRKNDTPASVWTSPITAQRAAAGRTRLLDVQLSDGDAYWIEGRPLERGRCVIVREHDSVISDLIEGRIPRAAGCMNTEARRCSRTGARCISPTQLTVECTC
jgi:hypothetical protein